MTQTSKKRQSHDETHVLANKGRKRELHRNKTPVNHTRRKKEEEEEEGGEGNDRLPDSENSSPRKKERKKGKGKEEEGSNLPGY